MARRIIVALTCIALLTLALVGCAGDSDPGDGEQFPVKAFNPDTGEMGAFETIVDVPDGWVIPADDDDEIGPTDTPEEPVCDDFPSCDLECPPGRHHPVYYGTCVNTCECVPGCEPIGCEVLCIEGYRPSTDPMGCPDVCDCVPDETDVSCDDMPACDFICPPGLEHPLDWNGCEDTCACIDVVSVNPIVCDDLPACEFACPPEYHNPFDENDCVISCECVAD